MKFTTKDVIKRSFTLMDGPCGNWFAIEMPQYCRRRQIFVAMGSPFGYSGGRTVDGEAWEMLLSTSALDFAETKDGFTKAAETAQKTVNSVHNTISDFWHRMNGLTPRPVGRKWQVVKWVNLAE